MNTTLFVSLFSVLGIVYLVLGFISARGIKTTIDYFLAGRKLGFLAVTFTLIATQLGGNMLIGTSEWAYEYGLYGVVYSFGIALGFLLLSTGFAAKLHACNVSTTAELFETKYNSQALRKIASIVSILSLCGILISLVVASKTLLTGLGIVNESIFVAFWLFVIIYTMVGGLKAVVVTDIFQVLFIIVCIGGFFIYCLIYQPAPLYSIPELFEHQKYFSLGSLTSAKVMATFLMPALFSLIEQDLAQRFFAARTKRIALLSALGAATFIIIFGFIPVYFGMQANLINLATPSGGSPLVAILELLTKGNILFVLSICGITAAITSTADSLLCAISSNISQDFNYKASWAKSKLFFAQSITFIAGIAAFLSSYVVSQNIIDIVISSYELSVACLLVPLVFALFKENLNKNAAICAAIFGLIGFIGFRIYPIPMAKEIATLALSLLGYLIGDRIKQ